MRKSWVYMGTTALILGITLLVAWFIAIIAVPIIILGALLAIALGFILPNNKGFYFTYDSNKNKLVKKRV
jgi:hypothetical protein